MRAVATTAPGGGKQKSPKAAKTKRLSQKTRAAVGGESLQEKKGKMSRSCGATTDEREKGTPRARGLGQQGGKRCRTWRGPSGRAGMRNRY